MAGRGVVVAALCASLFLVGACRWEDFGSESFTDDAPVGDRITKIRVANDSGDIMIRTGEQTRVHRTVHFDRDRPGATHRVEGDTLVIDSCPVRDCTIDYDLTVPTGTKLDGAIDSGMIQADGLAAVNLKISSGDVVLRGISGQVNLDASSGMVQLSDIGDAVVVRSESGDVTVDNARAAVTVQAGSGMVHAHGIGGPTDVQSSSGDVSVRLTSAQNVRAKAESGHVEVAVPPGAYRVSTQADSGVVHTGVTDDPAATHRLEVHTSSGDISVKHI